MQYRKLYTLDIVVVIAGGFIFIYLLTSCTLTEKKDLFSSTSRKEERLIASLSLPPSHSFTFLLSFSVTQLHGLTCPSVAQSPKECLT